MKQKSLAITIFALLNASVLSAAPQDQVGPMQQPMIVQNEQLQPSQMQAPSAPAQQSQTQSVQSVNENGQKQTVIVDQNGNLKVMSGASSAEPAAPQTPDMSNKPGAMPMPAGQPPMPAQGAAPTMPNNTNQPGMGQQPQSTMPPQGMPMSPPSGQDAMPMNSNQPTMMQAPSSSPNAR